MFDTLAMRSGATLHNAAGCRDDSAQPLRTVHFAQPPSAVRCHQYTAQVQHSKLALSFRGSATVDRNGKAHQRTLSIHTTKHEPWLSQLQAQWTPLRTSRTLGLVLSFTIACRYTARGLMVNRCRRYSPANATSAAAKA